MKAWMIPPHEVDHQVFVCHADTRGRAKSILATEVGADFTDVSVVRAPAADDLPLTDANLLKVGLYSEVECFNHVNCTSIVFHDPRESWLYSYGPGDEIRMALVTRDGRIYCSEECWRQHTSSRQHPK